MAASPEVLRVSVVAGHDRVDLVVPAAVRVAELLPELAASVPTADRPCGLVLSVAGGGPLATGAGLAEQGVADGSVLTLTPAEAHVVPSPVADDLATLVAELVEEVPRPGPGAPWSVALLATGTLLLVGAVGVVLDGGAVAAAVSAGVVVVLLGAAALEGRRSARPAALVVASWSAVVHAGAAGLAAGLAGTGACWLVVGAVAAGLARGRAGPLTGVPLAGGVLVVAGAVPLVSPAAPLAVLTCTLVAAVLAGELVPWLAAGLSGLLPPPLGERPPRAPERAAVADGVRRAHGVLLACSTAATLLVGVLAPVAATGGGWGIAVALLCCALLVLRSRRQRVGSSGVVSLLGGLLTPVLVAGAVWWSEPAWRNPVTPTVAGAGVLGLAAAVLAPSASVRAGRLAELAEGLALVALPPCLLLATGLLDTLRSVVP